MALPKKRYLLLFLAAIWIGGNLATVRFDLQSRPWFGWLVFGAIAATFVISYWDYRLSPSELTSRRRSVSFRETESPWLAIGMTALFSVILLVVGIYNVGIGNVPGGAIVCGFGGLFFIATIRLLMAFRRR